MSTVKREKGTQGENTAARFLENLGYTILHRNLRLSHLEIENPPAGSFGHPATWIDGEKQDNLRQAAEAYLQKFPSPGLDIRFDVVTITKGVIEHFPNAF
jgi:Holliday junction resolvase-like predicted endonuclease